MIAAGVIRIFDRVESRELGVHILSADALDLAHIDVLHRLAAVRIDRERPARTFPCRSLHRLEKRLAVGVAYRGPQRFAAQAATVITAHHHRTRRLVISRAEGLDELPVHTRGMRNRVEMRGGYPERGRSEIFQD